MNSTDLMARQQKQKYLRERIIQENLSPDEFATFLGDRRQNGSLNKHRHRCLDTRRTNHPSTRFYKHQTSTRKKD